MPSLLDSLKPLTYVQVSPERLTVRNVKSGEEISEVPEIALSAPPKSKLLGLGVQARALALGLAAEVVNPFSHPRTLLADFTAAEQLLKAFLRRLYGRPFLAIAPVMVLHPLGTPVGGFTPIENRAFQELAISAGAAEVLLWLGPHLTDAQIVSRQFPASGQILA